jgi:hypothetical protein
MHPLRFERCFYIFFANSGGERVLAHSTAGTAAS